MVAVATTYEGAKKAAEALKITYDNGPYAKVSDQTLIDEAKKLQGDPASGQLFVSSGDPAKAMQLLASLRNQNSISLTVIRGGQPIQLQYNIH